LFVGRLLPGTRQCISLPAGLARMGIFTFCAATVLCAGLWVLMLAGLGFWFGRNEKLVLQNLHWLTLIAVAG
jgi:membrane protein DedA with SNARE-associated domain